jgi:ABC-2 type transport system ATP-binding protein
MEKVIEITGLTKMYKNGRGITDINLEIDRGDIFVF